MKASLLVEIQTEELPPKALKSLSEAFAQALMQGLAQRHFLTEESRPTAYATPRRLAVHITQVLAKTPDQPLKRKLMPLAVARDAAGQWTAALRKKLEALGKSGFADLETGGASGADRLIVEADGKADAVFLSSLAPGQTITAALQETLEHALARLPIPKLMNYQLDNGATVQFVRPAHRLVALRAHAPLTVGALGLTGGTKTLGHRFHSVGEIVIHTADSYVEQLEHEGRVVASFDARRERIETALTRAAQKHDATVLKPDDLLDEVTALVEWPVVYESEFEPQFLAVPQECLILTMQQNQKYFALCGADGRLLNRFLLVSNIEARDPSAIVAGNARVIRARLADAKFFYDQDRKEKLAARVPGLAQVVYHGKLGSQLQRVERIAGIAASIARELGVDVAQVERAAHLAKADLRTLMVGEFPELQGVMGRYYALHDGEAAPVADAIEQHYRPRFAGDALPASRVGLCVALADKLETLAGLFGAGEKPTGERDPFALRRHALGVLRMLIEARLPLALDRLIDLACARFQTLPSWQPVAAADLPAFLYDRLRGLLRDQGYTANEVEAVVSQEPKRLDDVAERLAALRGFMALPEAQSLAAANKRIGNILRKSTDANAPLPPFQANLLREDAERTLARAFDDAAAAFDRHYAAGDFAAALTALAPLKAPIDAFFDRVMVNVDDAALRANRLALLARLRAQMNHVADLALLAAG